MQVHSERRGGGSALRRSLRCSLRRSLRRAQRRSAQFFRATFGRVHPDEVVALQAILTPAQMAAFRRMDRSDQRHSLDVFNTLRQAGHQDPELLRAALLHDAGKVADAHGPLQRMTVWHRTAVVLLHRLAPSWLARLAADGRGWKKPFAIHVQHAQASAALAAETGCTPEVVDLIRRHHEPEPDDRRLALLQWADEQN
jgi:putative nucleotidyltransferase with HDIG domain